MNRHLSTPVLCALVSWATLGTACRAHDAKPDDQPGSESSGLLARLGDEERRDGLLALQLDRKEGRLWLRLPAAESDGEIGRFLYVEALAHGLGSNPVGLDRGQIGPSRLVVFRRVGPRVLLVHPNLSFRAETEAGAERRATAESFAASVLWAGEIAAEDEERGLLVDFTSFVTSDAHGVANQLKVAGEGSWSLDSKRSVVLLDDCLAFTDNVELEGLLTFAATDPGREVRATTPTPEAVTLVQHHSFIRLPDDGYATRWFDPRMGAFSTSYRDYAAALDEPVVRQLAVRHRLQHRDPSDPGSEVIEPIVYYVDRGAPEPVRSALVEGASWWAEAFERAGFANAFRVELLPENVHPLDARYNVIQWVHRATRGWSYGRSVTDPRTGEILKGHVSLGSLRVRQDRLIFEGLFGAERTGTGGPDDPVELALARIRQLAAHEVGHTLGLSHNFAASTYAGRASVMDYPAPLIRIDVDGRLDASDAYGVGVGAWDVQAIRLLYGEIPAGADERETVSAWIEDGVRRGLVYLTDADARPAGASHPAANLWDNGNDPGRALVETLDVRRIALGRFGRRNLAEGRPLAFLQEVLAPLYFHHRYQLEAAVKTIGGLEYAHSVGGDGSPPATPVDGPRQRQALDAVLRTLEPEVLDLPDSVLEWLLPRPPGNPSNRELFQTSTAPAFDALGAAAAAADMAVTGLLQRERTARLIDFHRRDSSLPHLEEVLDALTQQAFATARRPDPRHGELERTVQRVVVARMIELASHPSTTPAVRERVDASLRELLRTLLMFGTGPASEQATRAELAADVQRHLERPRAPTEAPTAPPAAPPGSPIGGGVWLHELSGCTCESP